MSYQGIIEGGDFSNASAMNLLFSVVAGEHWRVIEGQSTGISQTASQTGGRLIWNFPFELSFESRQPLGWPRLLLVLYGKDWLGRSVVQGYASCPLPVTAGSATHRIPVFTTLPPSLTTQLCASLFGKIYEVKDPERVLLDLEPGRDCLQTKHTGWIDLRIHTRRYNFQKSGLE